MNVDDTSILLATQGTSHGANLFAYCENNPVNQVDYTGMKSDKPDGLMLLYTVVAAAAVQEIIDFGYSEWLEEDIFDFTYKIDKYGLYHTWFAIKGNRTYQERYRICHLILGELEAWKKMSVRVKRLTPQSGEQIFDAAEETSESIYDYPVTFPEGDPYRQVQIWLNTYRGVRDNFFDLYDAISSREYMYPYARIVSEYSNCDGISILYKSWFTNRVGARLNLNFVVDQIPETDSILKKRGINA